MFWFFLGEIAAHPLYMYVCTKISLYFQVEANGDILAEMILDDIIRDTAAELENLEIMERAEREAIRLQDNPTLENVFQRLEQMEVCSHHSGAQNFIFQDFCITCICIILSWAIELIGTELDGCFYFQICHNLRLKSHLHVISS